MFSSFGYTEMLLFGIIALMLFGSRLPDVARNFGRGYREMRRKVDELQREFRDWDKPEPGSTTGSRLQFPAEDEPIRSQPMAPKFVPPRDEDSSSNSAG